MGNNDQFFSELQTCLLTTYITRGLFYKTVCSCVCMNIIRAATRRIVSRSSHFICVTFTSKNEWKAFPNLKYQYEACLHAYFCGRRAIRFPEFRNRLERPVTLQVEWRNIPGPRVHLVSGLHLGAERRGGLPEGIWVGSHRSYDRFSHPA